jgi:DNA repair protein RadD
MKYSQWSFIAEVEAEQRGLTLCDHLPEMYENGMSAKGAIIYHMLGKKDAIPTPRPHQSKAIEEVKQSIRDGKKRPVIAAPCAFGKTHVAANILKAVQDKGNRGIFICDRIKLVQQTIEAFDQYQIDFGVMQGVHERSNPTASVQIASVQTLHSWDKRRADTGGQFINDAHLGYEFLEFDVFIIDECHVLAKHVQELGERNPSKILIGLSATPYSKGLGIFYDNLIVPITARELMNQGYLSQTRYFGGAHIDTSSIGARGLPTGGTDFDPKAISEATEKDDALTGDIVRNWLKYGEDSQTIAFSPSIKHSKYMVETFRNAGISAEHIDGYCDDDLRQELYQAHDRGEFKILSCSRLLNTGYDSPSSRCLIDCFPTKSVIAYVQRIGRVQRKADNKPHAIVLDHAGNYGRFGPAEDIVPDSLDDGEKRFTEKNQIKDKKEPKQKKCPQCFQLFVGLACSCGYEIPITEAMETTNEDLVELKSKPSAADKRNRTTSKEDKAKFYGELKGYGARKGFKQGWASNSYRERFGVWPNSFRDAPVLETMDAIKGYITSKNIARAKRG